jgi:large subunit ribosomal protein L18
MPRDRQARKLRVARHSRVRQKVSGTPQRPRLCVFRSLENIYVQLIDDVSGHTLAAASSLEREITSSAGKVAKAELSKSVGAAIAKRALKQGTTTVVFDRGGYKYHGRVKALADGAREGGLVF